MSFSKWWGLLLFFILAAGCAGAGGVSEEMNGNVRITVLLDARQSSAVGLMPSAVWVDDPQALDPRIAQQLEAMDPSELQWRRDTEGVLVIYMGRKATGGYHLSLVSPVVSVVRGVAVIQVHWNTPAIGAIVTQATTSPCLVLKVPRQGIKLIKVQDETGRTQAEVAVR